jgi:hypothetical protein
LPVGTVSLVERSRSGNFARVLVRPDAGVESSRLLLVLDVERRDDGTIKLYCPILWRWCWCFGISISRGWWGLAWPS